MPDLDPAQSEAAARAAAIEAYPENAAAWNRDATLRDRWGLIVRAALTAAAQVRPVCAHTYIVQEAGWRECSECGHRYQRYDPSQPAPEADEREAQEEAERVYPGDYSDSYRRPGFVAGAMWQARRSQPAPRTVSAEEERRRADLLGEFYVTDAQQRLASALLQVADEMDAEYERRTNEVGAYKQLKIRGALRMGAGMVRARALGITVEAPRDEPR